MMQFTSQKKYGQLIFRQWSRKAYAIFQSIGREVKIAGLSIELGSLFVAKTGFESLVYLLESLLVMDEEEGTEFEQIMLLENLIIAKVNAKEAYAKLMKSDLQ